MTAPAPSEPLAKDTSLAGLWPRFRDEALEAQYRRDHVAEAVQPFAQRALPIGAALCLGYVVADHLLLPDPAVARFARFVVGFPMMALPAALAYTTAFRRASQPLLLLFGIGAALSTVLIAALAPADAAIVYAGWLAIFVAVGPLVARYTLRTQLVYLVLCVAMLGWLARVHHALPSRTVDGLLWSTSSMGLFGAVLSWLDERQLRRTYALRRTVEAQAHDLARERARSESLLLNMLPLAVAARLKEGATVIADGHPEVTVLFADLVGFTALSTTLAPEALLARLNEVFTAFDERCAALGLEKIKTIGDAYMVVGGAPEPRPDHAVACVRMALAMHDALDQVRRRHGDRLELRIGIHSGPIVAGVIGTRKFAYDVWGDTVNTASRMESHSVPGRIQLSDATARIVEPEFELEDRGTIAIKGKGPMRTWFVVGPRGDAAAPPR